jgi:hypothetical protein
MMRRRRFLQAAGAAALVTGGAALAKPSQDADILGVFLTLERVQEAFYREAVERGAVDDDLLRFANAAADQETEHVAFLVERLNGAGGEPPRTDFTAALRSPRAFTEAAIALEEGAIGAYVAQSANLSRDLVGPIATLVSVEARQAAWVRDLAGVNPAPRVADPPRSPDDVLAALRNRGLIR